MKQFKHKKKVVLATGLVGLMAIGGIGAYFTDGETATNEFTIGRISIDLQEPNWIPPTNITPNQTIPKDPQVKNDGINEAYVFLEVTVPYKNIVVAELNGIKKPAADTELFTYTVNNGWTEIGTPKKDTLNGTVTHLYAFAKDNVCTPLLKGETTPALFDTVTFVNATEDQGLEETNKEIVINAYGIQTKDINGSGASGKTAPVDVWSVLSKQAPTTVVDVNEKENTDIKEQTAGLYDAEGNLLCTWEESGLNVSEDYPYGMVTPTETQACEILYKKYPTTTKVVIPKGITRIGKGAFFDCNNLEEIVIPNSVTEIGDGAFLSFSSSNNNLTKVKIPNSVTSIGANAFSTTGLTSVEIPDSVTSIGKSAFSGCNSLTEVTIPNSVTSIGANAFSSTGLTSVEIPDSVTSIGEGVFSWCKNLTSIIVSAENKLYDSRNNCNAIIETTTNTLISGCSNTIIPNNVTGIGNNAFLGCNNLTEIEIPDSVNKIGNNAFSWCKNLTSVEIPKDVISIETAAFSECTSLTSVTIPNNVTSIGMSAFYHTGLTSIEIPNSVTSIGANAFSNTGLTSVEIPDSVTSIGNAAFQYCKNLISITWKGTVYTEKAVFNQALKDAGIIKTSVWN